ncbi:ImmA/IrrE family metallo-endopeptidase [Ancylobacter sp. Lp-2]|uniref:ImmA/IrrE family metallo-endopeptidase n=1 Tax=Ancylobacter sp. Lp-2 TaxID=2881339 RepID=UPI001E32EA05|nr:ImmA/IrrE family metallo-endopeptidase [Ancylobacter sp. Lp-2]MCB4767831.1 ImmA/IrrE family metallo-endopeptidase [Ancylobacter sp. Lp-2]
MNMHTAQPGTAGDDRHLTAMEVISRHQLTPPVDVFAIAKALGLYVRVASDLPDNVSGKIEAPWFNGDSYTVSINGRHSSTRQRFTLAHEIAHFVLHRSLIGDGIVDDAMYRSDRSDDIERQANSYAATILMPAPLVRAAFSAGTKDYAGMSRLFDVSSEVARIRMRELRLGI